MYDLLEEYFSNLKIPTADEVKRDDLEDAKKHFNEVFEAAVAAVDDKKPKWIDSLEKSIATLSDDLLSILASLYSGDFMDPEIDPKVVLEKLEQVREELETISEKAETFAEWQRTFRIGDGEASLNSFKDTLTQYELKRDIWQRLDVWNESVARWKGDDFSKLKVEELRKDVEVYHEDISKLSKRLNTDPVVRHFMESIDAVRAYVPVIVDLGNTAMQTRHWKRVFERVEQPYFAGTTVSLEQLLKYGIEGHAVFIGEISGVASGEWALEQHLLKIKTAWEVTELPLTGHRDSAEMTLGSLEECVLLLKDSQVSLHTMMASPFVAAIRPEVEVWEKKLSVLSEVIDAWTTCQRNWIYLENIYGAEDIQKQLPGEAGKLQKVSARFETKCSVG
ncbi:dynein heavy chain, N-terminal region 2-domain-containing protein [Pavlovales sp. CCMP2436]|nr:dynein heavy chain, N-terminal region 2-domain-containing protein [Pavlovales sp. CCMP2436]